MSDGARDAGRWRGKRPWEARTVRRYQDATTIADVYHIRQAKLIADLREVSEQIEANHQRVCEERDMLRNALGDLIDHIEGVRPHPKALVWAKAVHAQTKRELVS